MTEKPHSIPSSREEAIRLAKLCEEHGTRFAGGTAFLIAAEFLDLIEQLEAARARVSWSAGRETELQDEIEALQEQLEARQRRVDELTLEREALRDERDEARLLRGWPPVYVGEVGVSHSPIDSYRCESEDCPSEYEVWQFRPDDHDLDESVVNCPSCGQPGELFLRHFRSDGTTEQVPSPSSRSEQ